MAEPIGALRAELSAGHAQFASDMAKARDAVRDRGREMETAMTKVKNGFDSAMTTINRFGAMAALAAGTGVAMFIKSAIDGADKMYKMSQAAGVSVESLSTLAYAAKLSDVDVDTLGTSFTRLSKNMSDAAMGIGTAKDAFDSMGMKIQNADGTMKTSADTLREIADKFSQLEDGAAKTAMAVSIFGRAGAGMIPMLNMGSAGIKELEERAKELGLQISTKTGQAAEKFNDQLTELKANASGLGISVAEKLLPHLNDMVKAMQDAYKDSGLLMAAWVALGGIGDALFVPSDDLTKKIEQAGKELEHIRQLSKQPMSNFSTRNWDDEIKAAEEKLRKLEAIKAAEKANEEARAAAKKAEAARKADAAAALEKQIAGVRTKEEAAKKEAKFSDEQAKAAQDAADAERVAWVESFDKINNARVEEFEEARKLQQEGELASVEGAYREAQEKIKIFDDMNAARAETAQRYLEDTKTETEKYIDTVTELYDLLSDGSITWETYIRAVEKAGKEITKTTETGKDDFKELRTAIEGWGRDSAKAIVDFVTTGEMSFKGMIDAMIADILRMAVYQNITKPIFGALGSLFTVASAKGNVFSGGDLVPFAKGGIVTSPTIFPMASGAGLMGEAGPEAVMPLTRLPGGDLGVKSSGGGGAEGASIIHINIVAADAKSFEDMCKRNPAAITGPVLQSLRDNKTRTEFKRLVN